MRIFCARCGVDLTDDCGCNCRPDRCPERSQIVDTIRLAAELGGVTADTLARASAALREDPS